MRQSLSSSARSGRRSSSSACQRRMRQKRSPPPSLPFIYYREGIPKSQTFPFVPQKNKNLFKVSLPKNKTLNSSIYLGFYGVCVKDERAMGFVTLLLSSKYIHSLDSSLLSSLVVKKTHTRDVVCCCERRRRLRRRREYIVVSCKTRRRK